MTGDPADMAARLRAVLPAPWFADDTPMLDGLLAGLGEAWAWVWSLLAWVQGQCRIATASADWLDRVALDLFGQRLRRASGESDLALRARISAAMAVLRATRPALVARLSGLTGRNPAILEPSRSADTGGWGVGLAWGDAGAWGNLTMPGEIFVTAYRPLPGGPVAADADIIAAVLDSLPVATIAWMRIES